MAATQEEVDRVMAAYEKSKEAPEYVESIALETQLNSGTDYRMVWTNKYPTD